VPAYSSSPPSALQALADAELPSDRLSVADSISLVQALRAVPDPRQRRGRRHGLQSVLLLALGAVLAGAHSYAAIADWAAQADHAVTVCRPTPHATTFGRVLAAVDVGALERALTGWVLARRARLADQRRGTGEPVAAGRQVLAVDGKTLRGARDQTGTQAKLMAVYDHRDRLVLAQTDVGGGDELAAFTATLATLPDLQDVLITADALHCQREHAAWLHARGGHYLFTVKRNQPALRQTLVRLPWACAPGQLERHHAHTPRRVPLGQDHRPRERADPPTVPARRPGDQGGPPPTPARPSALDRDGLRDHLADPSAGRSRAVGGLDPVPLVHREPAALDPRRHPR
jgi:hypothetical protein